MKPSDSVVEKYMNGDDKATGSGGGTNKPKAVVLYIHVQGTDYECKDCLMFIMNERCLIHRKDDVIKATDSCGLFIYGKAIENARPLGIITPTQSGLTHSTTGFSCKRCTYFNSNAQKCTQVDETSDGDDPGIIHPDACCNAWSPLS
jgi:hypothetical protein